MLTNNNKEYPIVSIGIPTYNRKKYLQQALESVLSQDYKNLEIIISDNASTDGTKEVCEEYAKKYPDKIRYYRNKENFGIIYQVKKVWGEYPTGKYFIHLSDDDYYVDNNYISEAVEFMENHENCSCVSSNYYTRMEKENRNIKETKILLPINDGRTCFIDNANPNNKMPICLHAVLIRRNILSGFDEKYYTDSSSDILLWYYLQLNGNIGHIDKYTAVFRVHGSNTSGTSLEGYDYYRGQYLLNSIYDLAIAKGISPSELTNWKDNNTNTHLASVVFRVHGAKGLADFKESYPAVYWQYLVERYFIPNNNTLFDALDEKEILALKEHINKMGTIRFWLSFKYFVRRLKMCLLGTRYI